MKKILYYLLFIMFLAGCSGDGIFYTLENEEKIENANNLADNIPLFKMLDYNGDYVVNGKRVWHSTIAADTNPWSMYPVPSGYDGDCTFPSIATLNGELYASIISIDSGYKSALLRYDSSGEEWEEITSYDGTSDAYYKILLFDTSEGMYINVVTYNTDSDEADPTDSVLYFSTSDATLKSSGIAGATSVDLGPGFGSYPAPIKDIIYDGTNTTMYMIYNRDEDGYNNGYLCESSTPYTTFTEVTLDTDIDDYDYTAIFYDATNDILMVGTQSDDDDYNPVLFYDQSVWYEEDYSDEIAGTFCDISAIQSNTILAGTMAFVEGSAYDGDGYFEIDMSTPSSPTLQENSFSDDNNYDSSDLESTTIRDLHYDSANDRLYAVTTSGLWLNTSDGSEREWALE